VQFSCALLLRSAYAAAPSPSAKWPRKVRTAAFGVEASGLNSDAQAAAASEAATVKATNTAVRLTLIVDPLTNPAIDPSPCGRGVVLMPSSACAVLSVSKDRRSLSQGFGRGEGLNA
jgi:hypothetical protein